MSSEQGDLRRKIDELADVDPVLFPAENKRRDKPGRDKRPRPVDTDAKDRPLDPGAA